MFIIFHCGDDSFAGKLCNSFQNWKKRRKKKRMAINVKIKMRADGWPFAYIKLDGKIVNKKKKPETKYQLLALFQVFCFLFFVFASLVRVLLNGDDDGDGDESNFEKQSSYFFLLFCYAHLQCLVIKLHSRWNWNTWR